MKISNKLAILGGPKATPNEILAKRVLWPYITKDDRKAINTVLDRGILFGHTESDGRVVAPETEALQKEFAKYIATKYCLAVNSGTAALHIALAGAGIDPGDEIITSAFSYIATPMAILHAHAIPIFVDIDINTQNIDASKIGEKITTRTKAIVPVHMNGLPCDMDEILAIAKKYNLLVIEDAAQAWGAIYKNRKTGSIGDAAAFSLNGTKNFSVGEGGLFVSNDKKIYEKAKAIAMMGAGPGESFGVDYSNKKYQHLITYNYKVQELTSALGRSRLNYLDKINQQGLENAKLLNQLLAKKPYVITPNIPRGYRPTFYKYRLRINLPKVDKKTRDLIFRALRAENVDVAMWQQDPLPHFPAFKKLEGYGKNCPWTHSTNSHYSKNYKSAYPNTQKLLDTSLIICSESYPIFCQPQEVIKYYALGITKVFSNINKIIKI